MKTLQVDESSARSLYKTSSSEFKIVLENSFGKEFFSTNAIDRIKTHEDACAELCEVVQLEITLKELGFTDDEIAFRKVKTITKALNEGWKPDWKDSNEKKWYAWFDLSSGGFVFDVAYYCCSYAPAGYGSRLCFKSKELAEYAGKQFVELYKTFMI